jgi:hypothetical protein
MAVHMIAASMLKEPSLMAMMLMTPSPAEMKLRAVEFESQRPMIGPRALTTNKEHASIANRPE